MSLPTKKRADQVTQEESVAVPAFLQQVTNSQDVLKYMLSFNSCFNIKIKLKHTVHVTVKPIHKIK